MWTREKIEQDLDCATEEYRRLELFMEVLLDTRELLLASALKKKVES